MGRIAAWAVLCLVLVAARPAASQDVLPGTQPLTWEGDLSVRMMDGAHRMADDCIARSLEGRPAYWHRDLSSPGAYVRSVEANRKRFMEIIGVKDKDVVSVNYNRGFEDRDPPVSLEKISAGDDPALVAETPGYRVYQVRWNVLNRVHGEGLLLQPKTRPLGCIVAIPDADQTPEQLTGLSPGIPRASQFARLLAENGFEVLVPLLVNRSFIFPGTPEQQTCRERIYRQAFHMGGHIIGYEVKKVIAAIDWFRQASGKDLKIGVAGYCEGGLLAFYAAAVDTRIDAALVSGYFGSRQQVWDEPIYRNVWGLLTEFGDAEIASLVVPRSLVVEYSRIPEIAEKMVQTGDGPRSVEEFPYDGYKGTIRTPSFGAVRDEFSRLGGLVNSALLDADLVSGKNGEPVEFGSAVALEKFARKLGLNAPLKVSDLLPVDGRKSFDPAERHFRQAKELEDHVQWLMRTSDQERNRFFLHKIKPEFGNLEWSTKSYHPYHDPAPFLDKEKEYRKYFRENIMGVFTEAMLPANPRTRVAYNRDRWTGYEVVLDVYRDLFAWGFLLVPKDIKPGEKRPVVVCQHGRNGLPRKLIEGNNTGYNDVAARLADQGFVVYVPHNLYRGEDRYRWLDRKANTVKKTLFSFIIAQHDQCLRWMGSLPFVDKDRIAFYGLSYGGESAMRIPAALEGYCLSICAGDFGDWTRKVVDTYFDRGFMNSMEWEMPYFNMGSTFSYAEMAYLIFPRPFMVERGHEDIVQPDEWVAYEYAKVRYLYDRFGLGDRTEIEFFSGGHSMRCVGTFAFLCKHLRWP